MPTASELSKSGVKVASKGKEKATPLLEVVNRFAKAGGAEGETADPPPLGTDITLSLVQLGCGLAALPKKIVEKIEANEYVDFSDLPPAKGKGRSMSQTFEGQVVVVQAADLLQSRKLIPDLATWLQCFALFTAAVARKKPERIADLMAYSTIVARASQKYRWPSWVIYDQNFRLEVAGNTSQSWAKVDPSIYAQCFTGQAVSPENWCTQCQGLDHTSARCPYRPPKRSWGAAFGQAPAPAPPRPSQPTANGATCFKYNKYNGDCRYGKQCRFAHICSSCGGPRDPAQRCRAGGRMAESQ